MEIPYEFGGGWGVTGIMVGSHFILYFLFSWINPRMELTPSFFVVTSYLSFLMIEGIFAMNLPGVKMKGRYLSRPRKKLEYLCNGLCSWYSTLLLCLLLHNLNIFRLERISEEIGKFITTSVIFSNLLSIFIYLWGRIKQENIRMTGNVIYDFFMGSILNPRIQIRRGILDLKMFAEIRISWMLLFLNTLSSAIRQYEEMGYITNSMILILIAHFLYTNACMKGEECIPTTWDIFYEKFGWMLIFWNFTGVPFLYSIQSYYIYFYHISISSSLFWILLLSLLLSYYVWDTANSQKNRFKMKINGTFVERSWAFPQLPWGTLQNPNYMTTLSGSALLVDGWWRFARKIHYTADLYMALIWGLSCGFGSFVPYFYFFFFLIHLLHRNKRDNERCREKYGRDWDRYCHHVPYVFIPYIY